MKKNLLPALCACLLVVGCGTSPYGADLAALSGDGGSTSSSGHTPTGFPTVSDFGASGPFPVVVETSPAKCHLYRPATLGENGVHHPVVVWGNGTIGQPVDYAPLLKHWASHGFVVAAANTAMAGTGVEMIACLDWVLAENARSGSAYYGHVDATRIGASGHSQGGGGSLMAGRDSRIATTVPLMPYTLGLGYDAAATTSQHAPMFLVSGGQDVIAIPTANQKPVFEGTNVPVFWGTLLTAGHLAALVDGGRFRGPMTAWLRARLMDDAAARSLFDGPSCGLCTDPTWKVRTRP